MGFRVEKFRIPYFDVTYSLFGLYKFSPRAGFIMGPWSAKGFFEKFSRDKISIRHRYTDQADRFLKMIVSILLPLALA